MEFFKVSIYNRAMTILLGLAFLVVGVLTVMFAQQIWNFTGAIDFIDSKFPGNTRAFIQLTGIVLVLLGILFVTGLGASLTDPIGQTFGQIFGR
jgi:uncharacterized membrane protein YidH (DUF202 family)